MDFPSAGDLWLISTIYPDGTVAALEELVGSHGGVGGEQTDAFLFHPPDLVVPETRCSTDVFHILDGHRNAPAPDLAISGPGTPRSPAGRRARCSAASPARASGCPLPCAASSSTAPPTPTWPGMPT